MSLISMLSLDFILRKSENSFAFYLSAFSRALLVISQNQVKPPQNQEQLKLQETLARLSKKKKLETVNLSHSILKHMPHIIIEHSADFTKNSVDLMKKEIPQIMGKITEGNFDADQCKSRSLSFDEYLVGSPNQSSASFLHITIKILSGRTLEARKKLSAQVIEFAKKTFGDLGLKTKRCDLSVDIVEMDKETYQKARIE